MNKWIKGILIVIGILVIGFFLIMFQPWVFLPHQKISIGLPFEPSVDSFTSLIPMGEKIEHNETNGNPNGHPGIDFGWNREVNIIAVGNGIVTSVKKDKNDKFQVSQYFGFYRSEYKELNTLEPNIRVGTYLNKGDVIGQSGYQYDENVSLEEKEAGPSAQIHWDFASSSMAIDRLCPVTYFDKESLERVNNIWERVPQNNQFKILYPDICSGFFKDKVE